MQVIRDIYGSRRFATLILFALLLLPSTGAFSQQLTAKGQEISDSEGLPVLVKHLPDWENAKNSAVFANNVSDLKKTLGERAVLDAIDFETGTEAVTAAYPQGKLLIIEFPTPQGSANADALIQQKLANSPQSSQVVYRRIGNYNAFVFDSVDQTSAESLLDGVKYEKSVQWLGENPFEQQRKERAFIFHFRDLFVAIAIWIILGLGLSALAGLGVGYLYFLFREKQRAHLTRFSDAGGMTRLNLDDLSEPMFPK